MRRLLLFVLLTGAAVAQQPLAPTSDAQPAPAMDAQQICAHEFGEMFKLDLKFPPITLDLDGDGQEDLVMVATSKNPLSGELEYHYRAIDPYDGYFGWGNAKDTVQFSATNAGATRYVLVVHNWRKPQAKFVIVNLPFDSLSTSRVAVKKKKKSVPSIHAIEIGGLGSDVYWDGKKYKWEPSYIAQE